MVGGVGGRWATSNYLDLVAWGSENKGFIETCEGFLKTVNQDLWFYIVLLYRYKLWKWQVKANSYDMKNSSEILWVGWLCLILSVWAAEGKHHTRMGALATLGQGADHLPGYIWQN